MKFDSIKQVEEYNSKTGHHFFKPDTMRSFKSIVYDQLYEGKDGWPLIVTSEKQSGLAEGGWYRPRMYTVRQLNGSGGFDTVGQFQQFASLAAAHTAARRTAAQQRSDEIRALARSKCDHATDIDENAEISEMESNGAWVTARIWVSFDGTRFDKYDAVKIVQASITEGA